MGRGSLPRRKQSLPQVMAVGGRNAVQRLTSNGPSSQIFSWKSAVTFRPSTGYLSDRVTARVTRGGELQAPHRSSAATCFPGTPEETITICHRWSEYPSGTAKSETPRGFLPGAFARR